MDFIILTVAGVFSAAVVISIILFLLAYGSGS
jgi:hypothetical protein